MRARSIERLFAAGAGGEAGGATADGRQAGGRCADGESGRGGGADGEQEAVDGCAFRQLEARLDLQGDQVVGGFLLFHLVNGIVRSRK